MRGHFWRMLITGISGLYSNSKASSFPMLFISCLIFFCWSKPRLPIPSTDFKGWEWSDIPSTYQFSFYRQALHQRGRHQRWGGWSCPRSCSPHILFHQILRNLSQQWPTGPGQAECLQPDRLNKYGEVNLDKYDEVNLDKYGEDYASESGCEQGYSFFLRVRGLNPTCSDMSIAMITSWSVLFLWKSLIPMNIRVDPPLGESHRWGLYSLVGTEV